MFGLSAVGAAVGTWGLLHARDQNSSVTERTSNSDAIHANSEIRRGNWTAGVGYAAASGALTAGLMLFLWPDQPVQIQLDPERRQAFAGIHGAF
jgi:hypothetical protein